MTFRRLIFWSHLSVAVVIGLFVFTLSVTGLLIAFERQIVAVAETGFEIRATEGPALSVDQLAGIAAAHADKRDVALVFVNKPGAAIVASMGRSGKFFLDPASGAVLTEGRTRIERAFNFLTDLHVRLALNGGKGRVAGRIVDAANLAFGFLLVSGAYLWWPKSWRWSVLRNSLLFRRGLPNSKARDYNWHHVFGVWALVPLIVIAGTGVIMSYSWGDALVYRAYGEVKVAPPAPPLPTQPLAAQGAYLGPGVTLQSVLDAARTVDPGWRTIVLPLARSADSPVLEVTVDSGNGAQADRVKTAVFDRQSGRLVAAIPKSDSFSPARQALGFIRFLHTGEVYGLPGQTIAALAALGAAFLAYTGLALAYRRLIQPMLRARRLKS